jgi:hypothetical protein
VRRDDSDYVVVLIDKVAEDRWPSIPTLRRIRRLSGSLPRYERVEGLTWL